MPTAKTHAPKATPEAPTAAHPGRAAPAPTPTGVNPVWSGLAWAIRPKLAVGAPNDPLEREADAVAEESMRMPDRQAMAPRSANSLGRADWAQRKRVACTEDESLRRKELGTATAEPTTAMAALGSPGRALESATREFFEPRLGRELGAVRVHADAQADAAARGIGARAFTLGQDIAFAAGEYAPDSEGGRRLLAHELTHVVQGQMGRSPPTTLRRVPLPGFSQGAHDTCQPASMLSALIIQDRERASPTNPNSNLVEICNAALIYLQQNRAALIAQWSAGGADGLLHFNNSVATATRIRDDLRPTGSVVTQTQYQDLAVVLSELGSSSDEIMRRLGLAASASEDAQDSLDGIFGSPLVTGLAPGQVDQIEWYVNTTVALTSGQTVPSKGYHMFLIGRGRTGDWFLSDQGQATPFEITAPDLARLRQSLASAAASGRSWIVTDPAMRRLVLTWSGVHRIANQDFNQPHRRLAVPGTFLAEVDAGWDVTGQRVSTWDFVGIAYSRPDAEALFPSSGNGHGFLVGEMPAGVFNVWKTNPVSADNMAASKIDASDSTGGLLVRSPNVFLHAWLYLRTSTTPATGARSIGVY